jgi:hypothetical protein
MTRNLVAILLLSLTGARPALECNSVTVIWLDPVRLGRACK